MEKEVITTMIARIPITFFVIDKSLNHEQEQQESSESSSVSPLWIPLRLFRSSLTSPLHGWNLNIKIKVPFSIGKNKILCKQDVSGPKSKSKTILESGKNSALDGQNIFFKKFYQIFCSKNFTKYFFSQKIDFSCLVLWSKSPPSLPTVLRRWTVSHTVDC